MRPYSAYRFSDRIILVASDEPSINSIMAQHGVLLHALPPTLMLHERYAPMDFTRYAPVEPGGPVGSRLLLALVSRL